jgi:hypothetical protein
MSFAAQSDLDRAGRPYYLPALVEVRSLGKLGDPARKSLACGRAISRGRDVFPAWRNHF